MSDDSKGDMIDLPTRPKLPPRFNIKDLINAPAAAAPAPLAEPETGQAEPAATPGKVDILPQPGDPYVAYGVPRGVPEPTLHVLLKDGTYRGFSWGNYDSIDVLSDDDPGRGLVLILRYDGLTPSEVRLAGQRLKLLHVYLGQQRIGWIRERPEGKFAAEADAPVIEKITITAIKP